MTQATELTRHEGCRVVSTDNGETKILPRCMGGTAILGCNDFETCKSTSTNPLDNDGWVDVCHISDAGIVTHITSVRRAVIEE